MRASVLLVLMLVISSCTRERESTGRREVFELFDGESLDGWRTIRFELGGGASASAGAGGTLELGSGDPMAGIVLENPNIPLPTGDYEIELEAMIVDGNDFFCGLTFPVPAQGSHCTLIVGGWGGTVVGLSNVNGMDASINTTSPR